jgi:hypothetical protein
VLPIASFALGLSVQGPEVLRSPALPPETSAWRAALAEGRPALRGFRAPILDHRTETVAVDLPSDPAVRSVAILVSRDLASRGLLATTAEALAALRETRSEVGIADLLEVGIPADLLDAFRAPGGEPTDAESIVTRISARLASGLSSASIQEELSVYEFAYRPSLEGFGVATESGEHAVQTLRAQVSSDGYFSGVGDGGSVDLLRQLFEAFPSARVVVSLEEKHVAGVIEITKSWSTSSSDREAGAGGGADSRRITWVVEPLPVAQWAQDSGKPGFVRSGAGGHDEVWTLVPRYASRGEAGALFVPGETFLADGLATAGLRVAQSALLFQGGDLLAAFDPRTGRRILFVGEANIWRNRSLGLTRDQAIEAFRVEFGVDRCLVLPAVSFHLDQELTLRQRAGRLVAFVPDTATATKVILQCGVAAMEKAGVLASNTAGEARRDLEEGRAQDFLQRLFPALGAQGVGHGQYPESFAEAFSTGPADSGIGNLQRFLLAIDLSVSWALPFEKLPLDPHSLAYLRSMRRRDDDRREVVELLRDEGFEVVEVPSLPEQDRGIDYLNGLHEPFRYIMPAWGGLYAPLDEAAEAALMGGFGSGIGIRRVFTGESQRRGGAVHCSISALPR